MKVVIPNSFKQIRPSLTRTEDFFPFWEQTLERLSEQDSAVNIINSKQSDDGLCLQNLSFRSFGNALIHGYLLTPRDISSGPLIVYTHGYMGRCDVVWKWAKMGASVFGVDIRGFGFSHNAVPEPSPYGYVLTGIQSEKTSVLRGAVCDYIRAVQLAQQLLPNRQRATVMYGRSFGGALAAIAAALIPDADFLVSAVPTFAWAEGRRKLVTEGSGAEINTYLDKFPQQQEQIMRVLSYFDTMNFASMINCDTLVGVGMKDAVVPAETVYAFINHLSCRVQVEHYPVSHTSLPEEHLWSNFEEQWLQQAMQVLKQSHPQQVTKTVGR